jgi:decaprenylphospho-beta-D-erythro-pentofuranosid-2-ulose 2-reductase
MKNVLIIGATSSIAVEIARIYAKNGSCLYLLARNKCRLDDLAKDLTIRGAKKVYVQGVEACEYDAHEELVLSAKEKLGSIDIVLVAHGSLPDQKECEAQFGSTLKEISINGTSVLSILTHIANIIEMQKSGVIAVITSVSGDRGRRSNYVYGAAKGMVSIFLQGLRNRLSSSGVYVLDIKPGFVDTPMTDGMVKGVLWVSPCVVAECIVQGINRRKATIYCPYYWKYIMLVIKSIPDFVFKRINL